jgi:hypothetical protein
MPGRTGVAPAVTSAGAAPISVPEGLGWAAWSSVIGSPSGLAVRRIQATPSTLWDLPREYRRTDLQREYRRTDVTGAAAYAGVVRLEVAPLP